ncbi:MAG: DEAD/DEAH box helicase family protein [Prevotella sp.]|nr:DEAD/DEAH box helicase family protein [Prevotella sp.]
MLYPINTSDMDKYGINEVLAEIRAKATSEKEKGTEFERLMRKWFLTDPRYENLEQVWLWSDFPGKRDLGSKDLGIDLVAKTDLGEYWAIQCKCYAENAHFDKGDVDSFLANASRKFRVDEKSKKIGFSQLVWVSTTRTKWGINAEEATKGLGVKFNRINLFDLEESPVDWYKLAHGDEEGKSVRLSGKQPREHQKEAIKKAYEYYVEQGNERGKLIMACGTGKTFTSLKIMEKITKKDDLVIFFVPSIALLGQTLNAWMADKTDNLRPICVCSDATVTRKMNEEDENLLDSPVNLAVPATTNTEDILRQIYKARYDKSRTVIMSTYQSIDTVSRALKAAKLTAALCICDEAHRTTGVKIPGRDESNFTKVHDNDIIRAKKRLYMTATPRLYRESAKINAKEKDLLLCSMDDEAIYGKEFFRLSFNDAVSKGLLSDYKVLVLTVSDENIPESIQDELKKRYKDAPEDKKYMELNFDDATKLIGCINGLSKRLQGDDGFVKKEDENIMKRAVAFCQTIRPTKKNPSASSTQIAEHFGKICSDYRKNLSAEDAEEVVKISAQHIDGSMDANERNDKIAWLKAETEDPNECRILCNVRCLSEGVDVPALDAVLFLSPRNSEVEVVQSVGRVMRSFEGKKYGYIIIPVVFLGDVEPEKAMKDNKRFKVVWSILNALRSHDENFNAHVNKINLNKKLSTKLIVGGVPHGHYAMAENGDVPEDKGPIGVSEQDVATQLELRFGTLQDGIYAKIVEKVGDKLYWDNWAKEVGQIAQKFIERIGKLVVEDDVVRQHFDSFVTELQKTINSSIDSNQCIEMLAQHLITKPVFEALFQNYQFVKKNVVSSSMQSMIKVLEDEGFKMDTEILDKFYDSVRMNVGNIDNLQGKQTIIKNLYEKFFKGAFPKTVEQLGIVYTPVECVDFIIRSVDDLLKKEFKTSLTKENVHILDPFTGTGTFITRLMQLKGVIKDGDMERKYLNEIHCNEIVLLAYYIANVNIESVYHERMKLKNYLPYAGICLTDTFQNRDADESDEPYLPKEFFQDNTERVEKQKSIPVRVIMGNPPYSVGQRFADDEAQNMSYPILDTRVKNTYAKYSTANAKRSIYDTYIKAFRWASDRIPKDEGGIVAFISNGSWIDSNALDGMRICFEKEFTSIYVLNLRGNCRTSGELRRREGDGVFGFGSRTPIAITFLVKNPAIARRKAKIYYNDIGEYLSREDKLKKIKDIGSIASSKWEWETIVPNAKADWINQRNGVFDNLIPLIPTTKFSSKEKSFFVSFSNGIKTNKDVFLYDSSATSLLDKVKKMVGFYNSERIKLNSIENYHIQIDPTKIVWTDTFRNYADKNMPLQLDDTKILDASYRPFYKQKFLYQKDLIERTYQQTKHIPYPGFHNLQICVSGIGVTKDFSCIITNFLPDLELIGKSQCFPMYWYEEKKEVEGYLFESNSEENFIKHDGISDWILKEVWKRYNTRNITKEMIFYYVYGLLHSPQYRETFANDLRKSLPRIPIVNSVDDFMDFYIYGKKLAALHLNYEDVPKYAGITIDGLDNAPQGDSEEAYNYFRISDKMRFKSKDDKSTIIYNGNIKITNIPAKAYEYIVNGKSAIEWIVERYCVSVDKRSNIKNDCNDWAKEHNKPRYVLDLLLSVINVSVQTVDIVEKLPDLEV